jgi:hypothetical protein
MSEFLLSANDDSKTNSFGVQMDYLDKRPYRLSPLRRMEFRTESNQLDPSRQDYGMRFNPANPWEIKNNNNYYAQYRSVLALQHDLALKDALIDRYDLIIKLLYYKAIRNIREENNRLTATQLSIIEKQQHSDYFNGEDFVKLKLDQIDQTVEMEEVTFDLDDQLRKMAAFYPEIAKGPIDWKYEDIISVDRVEQVVDSLIDVQSTPATLLYRESQIELANREYLLEKSNINIGFLQTQYQHFRIEQDRSPWSLSLGVTIPISNPNKGDMTKRKLEVIEAQHELDETATEIQSDKIVTYQQLKSLFTRYRDIEKKVTDLRESGLGSTLSALKEDNPVISLRFDANVLKLKMLEVKIRQNILLTYVDFLGYTDVVQQRPLLNFLTDELEHIGF